MIHVFGHKLTGLHFTLGVLCALTGALVFVRNVSICSNAPDILPLLESYVREFGGNTTACSADTELCVQALAFAARAIRNTSHACQAELQATTRNLTSLLNKTSHDYERRLADAVFRLNETSTSCANQLLNMTVVMNTTSYDYAHRLINITMMLNKTRDELKYHLSRGILVNGFCDAQVLQLHNCDRERMKSEDKIRDLSNRVGGLQNELTAARANSAAWDRAKTRLRSHREVFLSANDTGPYRHKQVAVCLSGQMRSSAATYLSLLAHFFRAFDTYDIFVQTYPADEDAARVFEPIAVGLSPTSDLPEGPVKGEIYHYASGLQGYLHQLHSLSLCGQLVANYSRDKNTTYDWVVRARPDIDILDRLPLLSSLSLSKMYILAHDGYGGVNDKLFFGPYRAMIQLLTSLYPGFYEYPRVLKPEIYLFDQINALNMTSEVLPNRVKTVKPDGSWGAW